MFRKLNTGLKNNKGFTLLELVVVIALGAVIMVGVAILISKGRDSSAFSTTSDKLQIIQAGLAERKVFNPNMPIQAAASTTWPTVLEPYIPADLRGTGTYAHSYQCATTQVVIGTQVMQDADQAKGVLQRLKDNKTCTAASTVSTSHAINCILTVFDGFASCK